MNHLEENLESIAVIGMSCRFPEAENLDQFWQNLKEGKECITFFSDEQLLAAGVAPETINDPNYVKARGILKDIEYFDASFFGYQPREAEAMDVQQRLFLECAWEALENAGYDSNKYDGLIGVYAGADVTTYMMNNLVPNREFRKLLGDYQILLANDKDYLSTKISYKLNLKGPSMTVQTACSTSMVALCLAYQGLLSYQTDMAIVGGTAVIQPQIAGYIYQEGMVVSPDGHCRAFDKDAQGTVSSNGVGAVVLKRMEDALEDRDHIYAIVKAAAVNNDGSNKIGYTAPGIDGQAEVIATAQSLAQVDPETITYIETHGTGTPLGDPIEMAALNKVFQANTDKKNFCALGAVKSNIGHLGVTAGVAGLIKTVLALQHKQIPPSLHFNEPNPKINFADSPFYVNTKLREWKTSSGPRRAGVSSFGIGGTNAHVILEEAGPIPAEEPVRPQHLLILSAKTETALESATQNLIGYIEQHPEAKISDICYTYQVGRREFAHRKMMLCDGLQETLADLKTHDSKKIMRGFTENKTVPVKFMFSGQGAQYVNMARELYKTEPVFQQHVDEGVAFLKTHFKIDLPALWYPAPGQEDEAARQLQQTALAQPTLFLIEYALAKLWMEWGVHPQAMIGHSIGEYVAATIAGVFTWQDGLTLVTKRAHLMQSLPPGKMFAVPLAEDQLLPMLSQRVALAVINGKKLSVAAGPADAMEELRQELAQKSIEVQPLHTSHAFHSQMMEPILDSFTQEVKKVKLCTPKIPYISNLTGEWITEEQAQDHQYWGQHLRHTVQFAKGLEVLLQEPEQILLEVGPGSTLSSLAKQHPAKKTQHTFLHSLPHPRNPYPDNQHLLNTLGKMWLAGAQIDWMAHANQQGYRIALPHYPFERKRHWVELQSRDIHVPLGHDLKIALPPAAPAKIKEPQVKEPQGAGVRQEKILQELQEFLAKLFGIETAEMKKDTSLVEMGAESLILLQVTQLVQEKFDVRISINQLLDELATLDAMAIYIDEQLPPEEPQEQVSLTVSEPSSGTPDTLEKIIERQLQIMEQQLQVLRDNQSGKPVSRPQVSAPPAKKASAPIKPAAAKTLDIGLSSQQQQYLDEFIEKYNQRTQNSKQHAQKNRPHLSDSRGSAGFSLPMKELIYPIVGKSAKGCRIWDIDDNEYIDFCMGFGVYLFGHLPDFLKQALMEQMEQGIQIGPQSRLAGEVAKLICEFTRMERVTFCNTGTEAVMAALRIARTATRRNKIALFAGSYHGTFDGVLASPNVNQTVSPIAPGIPQGMVDELLILDYDDAHKSLQILEEHKHELAAIIIEPVQSRRPELQPREFVQQLRQFTTDANIALIFDEVLTGFRIAPGGCQEWFGVQADIATYGKIVGSGIPIGIIAGKANYMNAVDGGSWEYGNKSYPKAEKTFFAGTFNKNPMSMKAAQAVLTHMKNSGPDLQKELNARTLQVVETLNTYFKENHFPIETVHFGSLFSFKFLSTEIKLRELFFFNLIIRGIYVWEGRTFFLSTAHTSEDVDQLIYAVKDTVRELYSAGLLLPSTDDAEKAERRQISPYITMENEPLLTLCKEGKIGPVDAVATINVPDSLLKFLNPEKVKGAFNQACMVTHVMETHLGRLAYVALPRADMEIYNDKPKLLETIVEALEVSKEMGASVVSLTGLVPSATNYGHDVAEVIADRKDLPIISTGHATTISTIVFTVDKILQSSDRDITHEHVSFVGLGSIGLATLRLMLKQLPHPAVLSICDVYSKKDFMEKIARELVEDLGFKGELRILESEKQVPPKFYEATLIVGATNVPNVVDVAQLKPGTLIVDDSSPHCFDLDAAVMRFKNQKDILFTEGGVLQLPQPIKQLVYVPKFAEKALDQIGVFSQNPFEIMGCNLSCLLSYRFKELKPTLGFIDPDTCCQHYEVMKELEFQAADLHGEGYKLPTSLIEHFRNHFNQHKIVRG